MALNEQHGRIVPSACVGQESALGWQLLGGDKRETVESNTGIQTEQRKLRKTFPLSIGVRVGGAKAKHQSTFMSMLKLGTTSYTTLYLEGE